MAIIYTYPAGGLKSSDNFVISDGEVNDTYKLSAGALLSWIDDNLQYDLQQVLNAGADADLDTGTWTNIKAWRDKSNQELLFYLDPTISAQNPSGRWETHTKLEMHKGLDASATITSVDGDNLFIRSGNSASLSLQGALNVSVAADGTISHNSGGFSGSYYNNLEESVTTGYHSTQVLNGYYKVLTVEDKQIYETSGGSGIGFEFKATPGVTTFPKLVLEDNISFHIKSKVVDSTGATGTTDQVLKSDVNGFVSWATDEKGEPGGNAKSIQYNSGGDFEGDDKFIYDSGSGRADVTMGKMGLTAGGLIIHGDNDQAYQANINMYDSKLAPNANRARIESPASYTADYDLILPVDGPSAGNSYLVSDASGVLSFNTVSPGGGASGAQYNIQVSDGSSNFTSTDAFKYDTTANALAVGLGNNTNTIVPSITVGSTTGKSGSLSLLNKDLGKLQIEPYNGLANTVKIIFPQYNSTGNQILQSDASNQLSWIDTPTGTAAAGSSGDVQFNDGSNAFAVAATGMKLNYDSTKGSLSTQSNIGNNAAYIGSSSSTTSSQSFTENLGTMNLINNNNSGFGSQYSTVLALKTLMTTTYQANPEFITFYDSSGGTPVGSIVYDPTGQGQIVIPTTSDERLKENKKDYDKIDAKSKIQSLKVKSYSFKEDADKREVKGFFAQEVKEVIPEAVIGSDTDKWDDGSLKPMSLNMHAFIPYLTSALQEAHDTIDKMKEDFKALENKVSELENSNGNLDNKIEDVKKDVSNNTGNIGGLDTKVSDIKSTADKAVTDAAEAKAVADKAKEKADTNESNIDKKADKGE